jgi:dienelactone hydrolase
VSDGRGRTPSAAWRETPLNLATRTLHCFSRRAADGRLPALVLVVAFCAGCFSERSLPLRAGDYVRITWPDDTRGELRDARGWLAMAHSQLSRHLPGPAAPAMLTDDLEALHDPRDIYHHFRIDSARLDSLRNVSALSHSAKATGARPAIERPAPPWPGFEDVWVPIQPGLALYGRLGLARRHGEPLRSDCIVLMPGLYGDVAVLRSRDVAAALIAHGLHVLAIELRAHGQTLMRYPDHPYTYGALETGDLLAVAEWLQARPDVRRTGLLGFCWSANQALLVAWEDGRPENDAIIPDRLRPLLRPRSLGPHYAAGVIGFSPVVRFEELCDVLEDEVRMLRSPAVNALQKTVRERMVRFGFDGFSGSLRTLIEQEARSSASYYPGIVEDGYQYLRLLPYAGLPAGRKLESARVPALLVHGANDPVAPAHTIAELAAAVENRHFAAIVLPGGGHVGFAPYARRYFYSLILNYFDPRVGAAAWCGEDGGERLE